MREGHPGPCRDPDRRSPLGGPTPRGLTASRPPRWAHRGTRPPQWWRTSASRSLRGTGAVLIDALDVSAPTRSDPDAPSFGRGEAFPGVGELSLRAGHEVVGAMAGRDGQVVAQWMGRSSSSEGGGTIGSRRRTSVRSADDTQELQEVGSPGEHRASSTRKRGEHATDSTVEQGLEVAFALHAEERRGGNGLR